GTTDHERSRGGRRRRRRARGPTPSRGLGRSGRVTAVWTGGWSALPVANVGGERPASGKVPVPSGGGWWELCAVQLINF
ncbi:Serine/threonine-protein kinase Nek5, partial [Zea mays]